MADSLNPRRPGSIGGVPARPRLLPAKFTHPSRQLKQHTAEIFEEQERSNPGEWIELSSSRMQRVRYDYGLRQTQVVFRDGTPWVYEETPPQIVQRLKRSASPGKFVNRVLNTYPYRRGDFEE